MNLPKTGAERVAAHRANRTKAGGRRIDAVLTPAATVNLDGYIALGMTIGQALSELLEQHPPQKPSR